MITEQIPRNASEFESSPTLSYEEYRLLCDGTQSDVYRKTGVSSQEDYELAQSDGRTIYVEVGGHKIPLFVPLEQAGGYNVTGTRKLTERENVYALALPLEFIDKADIDLSAYLQALEGDSAVVVQTSSPRTEEIKAKVTEELAQNTDWLVRDFIDPRCPEEVEASAYISVYTTHFASLDEEGVLIPRNNRPIRELYEEDKQESGDTLTELIEAEDLRNNQELFEQLWDLHDNKFDWLGKFHPVSMQENKEFFRELMFDDRTRSFVRFEIDGSGNRIPVCHGITVADVDWLTEAFKNEMRELAEENDESIQFFYGIAGGKATDKMVHYAKDVMGLNSRIVKRGGGKVVLYFESTTMSSLYIPRLIEEYVGDEPNGVTIVEQTQSLSKLDYWWLESPSNVTV